MMSQISWIHILTLSQSLNDYSEWRTLINVEQVCRTAGGGVEHLCALCHHPERKEEDEEVEGAAAGGGQDLEM